MAYSDESVEFFTLISHTVTTLVHFQVPISIVLLISKNRQVVKLLTDIDECILEDPSMEEHYRKHLFIVSCCSLIWVVVTVVGCVTANVHAELSYDKETTWNTPFPLFFNVTEIPNRVWISFRAFSESEGVVCDTASQMMMFMLIYTMSSGYRRVLCYVEKLLPQAPNLLSVENLWNDDKTLILRRIHKKLIELQSLLAHFNVTFSVVLFLNCLRDIMTLIAFIAVALEIVEERVNETQHSYARRINNKRYMIIINSTFMVISAVSMVIRFLVCIDFHQAVSGNRKSFISVNCRSRCS